MVRYYWPSFSPPGSDELLFKSYSCAKSNAIMADMTQSKILIIEDEKDIAKAFT